MHENRCYVELAGYRLLVLKRVALAAVVASALLAPGLARAELLPGSLGSPDAAVAPDGSPRVALVGVDGSLALELQVARSSSPAT